MTTGLQVTGGLILTPTAPTSGELVTAQYVVENRGTRPILLHKLGVVARGPDCTDWTCTPVLDFPVISELTLQPGEQFTYSQQRRFDVTGSGYFAEPALADSNERWYAAPGGSRVPFSIAAPTGMCTVSINGTAVATNQRAVMLQFSATGVTEMMLSNEASFPGGTWQPYATETAWELSDPGPQIATLTVYARFRDSGGALLCDENATDSILYDPLPPTLALALEGTALLLTATDQAGGSGVTEMQVSTDSSFAGASWLPFSATHTAVGAPGTLLYGRVRDGAGNLSATASVQLPAEGTNILLLPLLVQQPAGLRLRAMPLEK